MKIGIMTFWWSKDNYGQLLQCFALQKYLRDAGHDAYLIRYDARGDFIKPPIWKNILKAFNPVKLHRYFLFKKRQYLDFKEKQENPRNFEGFRNTYIKQSERIYYSYKELVESPPEADVYIVGSDQVLNTGFLISNVVNLTNAYLLNFGDPAIKRISYAVSFGKEKEELSSNFINIFTSLFKNFNYISVREKSGLEICKKCGVYNAEWVPDPTMLLDADIYRTLHNNEPPPSYSYCFLYIVGNKFNFSIQDIYDWAKSKQIEIIYVTGNAQHDKYKKTYATIPEWINLLENAEYVITNSFHCAIFSLIFKKKFGIIPLVGIDMSMNNRFDSLFQFFEIKERYIKHNFNILDTDINWCSVDNTFKKVILNCKLNNIINGNILCH